MRTHSLRCRHCAQRCLFFKRAHFHPHRHHRASPLTYTFTRTREGLSYTIKYFSNELSLPLPPGREVPARDDWTHHDDPATGLWTGATVNAGLTDKERGIVERDAVEIVITE